MSQSRLAPEAFVADLFLRRLTRLIRLRREYTGDLNAFGLRMIDRCIAATYSDCIDYGVGAAARPVMAPYKELNP